MQQSEMSPDPVAVDAATPVEEPAATPPARVIAPALVDAMRGPKGEVPLKEYPMGDLIVRDY